MITTVQIPLPVIREPWVKYGQIGRINGLARPQHPLPTTTDPYQPPPTSTGRPQPFQSLSDPHPQPFQVFLYVHFSRFRRFFTKPSPLDLSADVAVVVVGPGVIT